MRTITIAIAVAGLLGAGCGKKDEETKAKSGDEAAPGEAAEGGEEPAKPPAGSINPSAANELVPDELKGKLEFVAARGEKEKFEVLVPKGWVTDFMPGSYEPPEGADFGSMTRFRVSSNCDGACEAKDWAATVEKVELRNIKLDKDEIVRNDKTDTSRFVVAKRGDRTDIAAAWWKPDSSRYYYCRATLDSKLAAAADAFVKACESMAIKSW